MSFTKVSRLNGPTKVYRYFKDELHAEDFLRGKVRISTLNRCREYENLMQGDKHEASLLYYSGNVGGIGNDPDVIEVASRLGMDVNFSDNTWVSIHGTTGISSLENAYVFCTSTKFSPEKFKHDFGDYCVQIIDPDYFLKKLTETVNIKNQIYYSCAGKITYKKRHYIGLEEVPEGDPAFIKPLEYQEQFEYRFLLHPQEVKGIDFIDIETPRIIPLLTRLA